MNKILLHRNSQPRFYSPDYIYYVVTKTHKNFPFFKDKIFCDLLIEELQLAKQLKKFKLFAFSIIYDHLNLMIQCNGGFNVSQVMHFVKRHFSRNANIIMGYDKFIKNKHEGGVGQPRLRREINQFDQKILKYKNSFQQNKFKIPKFKWQDSFHDHVIRNNRDFVSHINYTNNNPSKHQLPDDWPYSSINYPDLIENLVIF